MSDEEIKRLSQAILALRDESNCNLKELMNCLSGIILSEEECGIILNYINMFYYDFIN